MRTSVAVLICGVLGARTAAADDGADGPHLLYAELLGKGGLYGVGYEYRFAPRLAVGGAGSIAIVRGQRIETIVPYLHATLLGRRDALFGELGGVVEHSVIASRVPDWDGASKTGSGGFASLGYEHARHRHVIRASASLVAGAGGVSPWLGFAIGARP